MIIFELRRGTARCFATLTYICGNRPRAHHETRSPRLDVREKWHARLFHGEVILFDCKGQYL